MELMRMGLSWPKTRDFPRDKTTYTVYDKTWLDINACGLEILSASQWCHDNNIADVRTFMNSNVGEDNNN